MDRLDEHGLYACNLRSFEQCRHALLRSAFCRSGVSMTSCPTPSLCVCARAHTHTFTHAPSRLISQYCYSISALFFWRGGGDFWFSSFGSLLALFLMHCVLATERGVVEWSNVSHRFPGRPLLQNSAGNTESTMILEKSHSTDHLRRYEHVTHTHARLFTRNIPLSLFTVDRFLI